MVMWWTFTSFQPAHATTESWSWPLEGPHVIERAYDPPITEYSSGHRGVDLPATEGLEVLAPADGTVRFAGMVVDRGVLSITHGKYISSFEPVTATVTEGQSVKRGQVIGFVSQGAHCSCLHVGARVKDQYISPIALLSTIPRAVLLPW